MSSVVAELLQPSAAIGWYRLDPDLAFLSLNAEASRLLGRPEAELLGRRLFDAFPQLRGSVLHRHYAEVMEGAGGRRFLFRHLPADRWYAVAVDPLGSPQRPNGLDIRFGDASAELGDLRAEIAAERLDAAARALGRLAHDMNNCLTVALGNAEFLEEELADRPELLAAVRLITETAERGAALTGRVLRFARRERRRDNEVAPERFLPRLAEQLQAEAPAWPVELACAPAMPRALAAEEELEAALRDLVLNARAAMPEGGTIRLVAEAKLDGDRVAFVVEDAGRGLPEGLRRRCVEPFVTDGPGVGLGLSAVHGFAVSHGGLLRLEDRPRGGLRAVIELPGVPRATSPERRPEVPAPHGATVLLVDDDPSGRAAIARVLASLGYGVIEAASSGEALAALRAGARPSVILADIILPGGLDGGRLVEQARGLLPGLPAILMSGYAARPTGSVTAVRDGTPLLAKPFRRAELAGLLGAVLPTGPLLETIG